MRLQLALNVADLDEAVEFYTKMFGVGPAKTKPGYANFAIDQPPLKLVLFEGAGETGTINHLGVETESSAEVVAAEARLSGEGIETTGVDDTVCCYAEKTETWVHGPEEFLLVVLPVGADIGVGCRHERQHQRDLIAPDRLEFVRCEVAQLATAELDRDPSAALHGPLVEVEVVLGRHRVEVDGLHGIAVGTCL